MIQRLEWMLAQLTQYTLTAARWKKKGGGDFTPDDFMPVFRAPEAEREATLDDLQQLFKARRK